MTYQTLIRRLNRRGFFRIKPGLTRIRRILRELGDPQNKIPVIHIAGTNGKGSVAAALESVLRKAGYRTGLYTSPHLVDLTERIRINHRPIPSKRFAHWAQTVLEAESRSRCQLTYFEFVTAVGFLAFANQPVDVVILECGLGGLWDATNTVERPLATVITSIGIDHAQWLGDTERAIALQKAGILKPNVPVISGVRGPGHTVLAKESREKQSPLSQLDVDFGAEQGPVLWRQGRQQLRYWNKEGASLSYLFGLVGSHQADNAAVVLRTLEKVHQFGYRLPAKAIREGLEHVRWPGRFDFITRPQGCPILFDGAHNPQAMKKFLQTLQESTFRNMPKSFIFSAYRDKDYRSMAAMIQPLAESIHLCSLPGSRRLAVRQLRQAFKKGWTRISMHPTPNKAFKQALRETPPDGLVVVTGSLALVGQLMRPWMTRKTSTILEAVYA